MRIAVTIESFGSGGAETSTRQICEGLRDRGCEVTLVTGHRPRGRTLDGIAIEAVGEARLRSGRAVRRYRRFASHRLRSDDFDTSLSVTTLCPARVVQPRAGIYRELWSAAPQWATPPRRARPATRPPWWRAKRRSMWEAEGATLGDPTVTWVAISGFMREQIARRTGRPTEQIEWVPNAAPATNVAPAGARRAQRAAWDVPSEATVFLFAGNDPRRKGLRTLCEAWPRVQARHAEAWWVCLGARGFGCVPEARTRWLDATDQVPSALAAADVLVLPSFYDPAAKMVAEALHAGVPVITTRTNGSCDLLEGSRAGRILDRADEVDALAAAMLDLGRPVALAEARAATSRVAAAATMDLHVDALLAILRRTRQTRGAR